MLTWIRFWPVFAVPMFVVNALGFLPTIFEAGRYWGGGPIRQWMLNMVLIPILSYEQAESIVAWFDEATVFEECLMYGIIILNLNILVLPLLYTIGNAMMRFSNWITVTNLDLKRKAAR